MKRRKFLQVAGVSTAGVAATACLQDPKPGEWMPHAVGSEDVIPGIPTWYASTCRECAAGCGILVKTRDGRPVKIEGNPEHPVNRGRLCARGQAALQGLYDPDRVRGPMRRNGEEWTEITWDEAEQELANALNAAQAAGANRVAYISGAATGPLDAYATRWLAAFGSNQRLRYEAFAFEPLREAARQTQGVAAVPVCDFSQARYILSFGADFLETWLSPTMQQRGFSESHGYREGHMAKFVAVETRRGLTGFNADEWVQPRPGTEGLVALAIANAIVAGGHSRAAGGDADTLRGFLGRFDARTVAGQTGVSETVIERIAREFAEAQPSLAVAGGVAHQHRAATQTAVAVNLLNIVAGNVGRTVTFPGNTPWDGTATYAQLMQLVQAMNGGAVDVVMVHNTNPAFTTPPAAGFAEAFAKVRLKVAFSSHLDETAQLCDLILPDHHALESWDIVEPMAGVSGTVQPVVRPVYGTKQTTDVLISIAAKAGKTVAGGAASAREMVAGTPNGAEDALMRGGVYGAATQTRGAAGGGRMARDFARLDFAAPAFEGAADGLVMIPAPSAMLYDGRGANKQWLQEIPDPTSKVAWQTWVEVHPETAARLGIATNDVVTVSAGNRSIEAVVYVYPGIHRDAVSLPIGRGHTAYGRYAMGHGSNPIALLGNVTDASGALAFTQTKVTLAKTGTNRLATTEGSSRQHDRGIARMVPFAQLAAGQGLHAEHDPFTPAEKEAMEEGLRRNRERAELGIYSREHPKWEMTIDLARCTGCSACVAACYAENNIPIVGVDQVQRSREMAWIRIERYYEGDTSGTDWQVAQTPMLCQHCENAPCEPVCPVYAAYHTPDGLNGQIYNRCVGTRYCANNCPYKVRYFNWWDYGTSWAPKFAWPGTLALAINPDVTVRTKGIMEKCTFCVQRIRFAQNTARTAGRTVEDAEVQPACAMTCPSEAIQFGNARDESSSVARLKHDHRAYQVLSVLNTRPGVTYLARVVHAGAAAPAGGQH